ncbi:MAG: histidine kinase [Bacteroidota bacterium]
MKINSSLVWYKMILLLMLAKASAFSQAPSYEEYTTRQGLAQNQVTAVFQDEQGYMWIGTKAGLSRFDGVEFENFYIADGLPENHVCAVSQSPQGDIYVLTRSGLAVWDGNEFESFPHPEGSYFQYWTASGSPFPVTHLPDGWVLISATNQPAVAFKDGNYVNADTLFPGISAHNFRTAWVSDDYRELLFYNRLSGEMVTFTEGVATPLAKGRKGIATYAGKDLVAIQTEDSVFLLERKGFTLVDEFSLEWEKNGRLVLFVSRDEYYTLKNHNEITAHINGKSQRFAFDLHIVNQLFKDREGSLWVTGEGGALKIITGDFISLGPSEGAPSYPWSVTEEPGRGLWVGSYGEGLFLYDGATFRKMPVKGLSDSAAAAMFYMGSMRDHKGNIWKPHNSGVVKIENGQARLFEGVPRTFVLGAHEHPADKSIILIHVDSFTVIDTLGRINTYPLQPGDKHGIMVCSHTDKNGVTWLSNVAGISLWDGEKITHLPADEIPFDKGAVTMERDHKGNMWLGNPEGLFFYDYTDTVIKIAPSTLNRQVKDIAAIDSTGLFIGMIGEMGYLDLEDFYRTGEVNIDFYGEDEGFPGLEVQQNGSNLAADGSIWFCTQRHIVNFDPNSHTYPAPSPRQAIITGLSFRDKDNKWENTEISGSSPIVFEHWQNNIRFAYKVITTLKPRAVKYRYKIKELNENWSEGISERFVNYTYLPAGSYTFMLDATRHDGEWSNQPVELSFEIRQAWWQTSTFHWVMVLLIIFVSAGIALGISSYRRKVRWKQMVNEKQLAELRLEALRAQTDPHFIFNILNSVALSVLQGNRQEAYDILIILSRLIRQAFYNNEEPYASLAEEINLTQNYLLLQKQRYKDVFDYEIIIDENVGNRTYVPRLFLQTLVENALKHGILPRYDQGKVSIRVKRQQNKVLIEVEDNGIGRRKAAENNGGSTGKGLMIAQKLFAILNHYNSEKIQFHIEDLTNGSNVPAGTRVRVAIPDGFCYEVNAKG